MAVSFIENIQVWIFTLWVWIQTRFVHSVVVPRRRPNASSPPTASDPAVRPEWLTQALTQAGEDVKDKSVTVTNGELGDNRGLAGHLARVEYTDGGESKSLIVKTNRVETVQSRYRAIAYCSGREKFSYDMFKDAPFLPKAIYSGYDSFSGECVIVMEDLKDIATGINLYCGNQIWGKPTIAKERQRDTVAVLEDVYTVAAEIHSQYWRSPELLGPQFSWMKSHSWYHGRGKTSWMVGMNVCRRAWAAVKQDMTKINWAPELVAIMDRSFRETTWARVQERIQDPKIPYTLCHGDFHASNMLYRHDTNHVVLVDWSETGLWEPMCDIGQIMISDVKPDLRRQHEKDLVRGYWDKLIASGKVSASDYPWEQCWTAYETYPVERWLLMVCLLASMNLPPVAVQYFHDQVYEFIKDHPVGDWYLLAPAIDLM